jgi:asparagine synthase (glutamine-hydrolysing)
MCDQIRHRGPDDEGFHVDGGCGIGMRRLSIIDLATGHQPMSNEDGTVWVVFNGEIYNYQELRADLIRKGHQFRTNSDTETLIHLYEEEATEGIQKLRGMFAYAIWDSRTRSVLLVRDRFGKKPLYYAALPQGLYFGSELKCLRVAGVPLDIDEEALQLYFWCTYIPDPWSPYKAIRKLPAGGWMRYHANGKIEQGRYWKQPVPVEEAAPGFTEADACERVRELFDESVRLRLISDVPLGAFLSGGIDSSSVVASMTLQTKEPVKTFSIGFEEPNFNELPLAALVAKKYKTDHHDLIVRPNSVDLVTKLVKHFDEPFADSSAIPTYLVSELAAQHVKVALTGDGGDELFAGYESFFEVERYRGVDRIPQSLRKLMSIGADLLPYSMYGKNYLRMISRPTGLHRYLESVSPNFLLRRLLRKEWARDIDVSFLITRLAECFPPNGADLMTQVLYYETAAKLTGDMLVKVDRMSMANSLEVRCPMLDHKLADLAAQIPYSWNMKNRRGKQIFLKALGDRLPPELLNQPKRGFGVPLALWFRGSLRTFLWDHLTSASFLNRGIVAPEFVRHLLSEHDRGRRNNYHQLYKLLMLELWFRESDQYHDAPAAETVEARVV